LTPLIPQPPSDDGAPGIRQDRRPGEPIECCRYRNGKVLQSSGFRPEAEELQLLLRVPPVKQQRAIGERRWDSSIFQNQPLVTSQHGHAEDAARHIRDTVEVNQ
jgi:hypothetical protein